MKENLRKIKNYAYLFLAFSIILFIIFLISEIKTETFVELTFLILLVLDIIFIFTCLYFVNLVREKNKIIERVIPLLKELYKFQERLVEIIKTQDIDRYDSLFMKAKNFDNPDGIIGDNLHIVLSDYALDADKLFNGWYERPKEVELYIIAFEELIKEMRKPFSQIPAKLKKYKE